MFCMGLLSSIFIIVFYLCYLVLGVSESSGDKAGAFECGFCGGGMVHVSYSIHFFIMMMMFIFFDLEVVMFLSVVVSNFYSLMSYTILFVFIFLSFYVEWWYGKLIWSV
uniref:NADH-ubiquinone oxidoreductase chain 3 n=1 Tax=Philometroides sanguineus TaxID=378106 RepID=A0A0U1XA13_9BILA|nr:NADH dehydrogenase subunit 3 [Philometroides sanguineus]AIN37109.1 NADH dehydrogenase subunit 3 [Philometroides sanguineus]